jgi:hypothetical protein
MHNSVSLYLMDKIMPTIDCNELFRKIDPKRTKYPYEQYRDRLVKVAFDVVRFIDSENLGDLWKVETDEDGKDYIVAMYDQQGIPDKLSSDWQVISTGEQMQVFYKNSFITKVDCETLGLKPHMVARLYPDIERRLAKDKGFVKSLLKATPEQHAKEIVERFPELVK